jgi:uncharacterized protein
LRLTEINALPTRSMLRAVMQAAFPTDQSAVIAFLSDPASYGLRGETVEQIGTHCSIVFLAGNRAYKLKRAIHYASPDYTTPTLRRAACEAEPRR